MGFQLHETMYGKNFFEHQLPALIRAINRLADVDEKRQAAEPAAVMKSNTVYVCYEENSHELAIEDGAVNELYVASSLDEVYRWVDKQQKNAEQNFYTVLNNEKVSFIKNSAPAVKLPWDYIITAMKVLVCFIP